MTKSQAQAVRREFRGFTLIECCIVLASLSVLISQAVPAFKAYIGRQHVGGAAAQFSTDLRFARSIAVSRNVGMRVTIQRDTSGTCYIIHTGSATDCNCTSAGRAECTKPDASIAKADFFPRKSGLDIQANVSSMVIDPRAGTVSPAGTVNVSHASGALVRLIVSPMGRIRACGSSGNAEAFTAC